MIVLYHLLSITLAVVIDRILGDPRSLPHPVVGMGRVITFFERRLNHGTHKYLKGWLMMLVLLALSGGFAFILIYIAFSIHVALGIFIEAWIISTTIATKGLKKAAIDVEEPLLEGRLIDARRHLSYIVGRDTTELDEEEISRATIETVAENTSDGITAPLFYALIGGAPLAMIYRAVNTGDSMVGYLNDRYKEFGYAAAKLDDALNFIPSRLSGIVMIACNQPHLKRTRRQCLNVLFRDAKKHPSPNSGWGEAAMAAILAIQLGGRNMYFGEVSNRAKMGDPLIPINVHHISVATEVMTRTVYRFTILLWMIGGVWIVIT
ncbi:adenosylcobinamide-phosphate synthase CbiB [Alkalihalophilus lindianensis]|uniref:Cobalamin biosynthesis protein CobD n=1 Tax=Alkalihalophilus lindianensis TaxID=1630542 RepID=A0ABU3X686_9BACI|nr:adenosylcobinamide-phosphate synthase CbiB [Alkalihalophilus lindianensis]MDV2683400.1 adenosylcobinamide-phosphate synthase CbiB [Alkalihalophilus lindianensis]